MTLDVRGADRRPPGHPTPPSGWYGFRPDSLGPAPPWSPFRPSGGGHRAVSRPI